MIRVIERSGKGPRVIERSGKGQVKGDKGDRKVR